MIAETFLTDFADQAVILPLLAAFAAALWAGGWPRGGAAWIVGIGAALATMGLLKLMASICHGLPGLPTALSPSGHTAAAAVVAGAAAALLRRRPSAPFAAIAALAAGGLIGWTRLALGVHGASEVAVGLVVGVAGAAWTVRLAGHAPPGRSRWPAVLALLLVLAAAHGRRLDAEVRFGEAGAWVLGRLAALDPLGAAWATTPGRCQPWGHSGG